MFLIKNLYILIVIMEERYIKKKEKFQKSSLDLGPHPSSLPRNQTCIFAHPLIQVLQLIRHCHTRWKSYTLLHNLHFLVVSSIHCLVILDISRLFHPRFLAMILWIKNKIQNMPCLYITLLYIKDCLSNDDEEKGDLAKKASAISQIYRRPCALVVFWISWIFKINILVPYIRWKTNHTETILKFKKKLSSSITKTLFHVKEEYSVNKKNNMTINRTSLSSLERSSLIHILRVYTFFFIRTSKFFEAFGCS